MIRVFLNDEQIPAENRQTLASFIRERVNAGPFAVAVNNCFIAKTEYERTRLQDGDRIDLVAPMQGG